MPGTIFLNNNSQLFSIIQSFIKETGRSYLVFACVLITNQQKTMLLLIFLFLGNVNKSMVFSIIKKLNSLTNSKRFSFLIQTDRKQYAMHILYFDNVDSFYGNLKQILMQYDVRIALVMISEDGQLKHLKVSIQKLYESNINKI